MDSWTATSITNAPNGRYEHTAIWTGSEMIVWGGFIGGFAQNDGGRYNPSTDSWTATSTANAPSWRGEHAAVWTGSEMIIWGGWDDLFFLNTGGRYKPGTDSWTATSTTDAPASRFMHTAVWNGREVIVWGGWDGPNYFNTGGKYNPSTNSWTATSTTNAPSAGSFHTAVWTGSEMIVWGGYNGSYLNTGGRYCAQTAPTININPSKDNTLYEYVPADGDRSNGVGDYFFAGKTAIATIRRGVLAFDIAGSIPPGSTITSVNLSMHMSMTRFDDAQNVELHKLLADWGEGTSDATGEEGQGAPATTNDATWRHRFYDTIFWTTQGGDFSNTVSASQSVGAIGDYTWSSAQMVADVQSWLDNPAGNFGWLVLGNESANTTAKRFDTRESTSPPVLTIEYTAARDPDPYSHSNTDSYSAAYTVNSNTNADTYCNANPVHLHADANPDPDSYTHSDPSNCLTL